MAARRRRALALLLLAVAAIVVVVASLLHDGGPATPRLEPFASNQGEAFDPFAYEPPQRAMFERRAAAGLAHVLYARSPGGVEATARRVVRYRALVERVARRHRLSPDLLEALVFLESAGRPDARASNDLKGAAGLTQILAETATNLLDLHVDVDKSARLTRGIARGRRVAARRRERRRVDERFDPAKALAATGRYLDLGRRTLGRDDLAFESYHMGIGNLQTALRAYGEEKIPYAQLFFDSSPVRHADAHRRLAALGDDSATYLWRLLAARDIMRLYRTDLPGLRARAAAQLAKNSAEEVLHPKAATETFGDPFALGRAQADGRLVRLDAAALRRAGIVIDPQMGEMAGRLKQSPRLYRALRPAALRILLYIGTATRQISGATPLRLTSTARDASYQAVLAASDREATHGYSLHTTGFAFDIARDYATPAQAMAFQFALDRLTALDRIAWVREPGAIHITAAGR